MGSTADGGRHPVRGPGDRAPAAAGGRRVAKDLQYVYQDPGASLDPRWKIVHSLHEPLKIHTTPSRAEREREGAILSAVGLPDAHLDLYPHELSGGQQRRVGLARILTLRLRMVILDEPISGLDVSVQASVLKLFPEPPGDLRAHVRVHLARSLGRPRHVRADRRDVPRQDRRARRDDGDLRTPETPLHAVAARRGAPHRRPPRLVRLHAGGRAAQSPGGAERLPLARAARWPRTSCRGGAAIATRRPPRRLSLA